MAREQPADYALAPVAMESPAPAFPGFMSHEALLSHLQHCSERSRAQRLSFGDVCHELGADGLLMALVLLSLPFLQPLTLGPLSSVGGLIIAAVGWQLARGRQELWLPKRLRDAHLTPEQWTKLLAALRWLARVLARVTRQRLTSLTDGPRGRQAAGWLAFTGGILLALPFAGVPFNNTLPALMVISAAAAVLERDGLLYGASLFWCAATVAYFALILYVVFFLGAEATTWLRAHVPWLGG